MGVCFQSIRPTTCKFLESDDLVNMIAWLGVRMADAERNEGQIPWDERQHDEDIVVQVVYVVRRRLLLVMLTFPPCAQER